MRTAKASAALDERAGLKLGQLSFTVSPLHADTQQRTAAGLLQSARLHLSSILIYCEAVRNEKGPSFWIYACLTAHHKKCG